LGRTEAVAGGPLLICGAVLIDDLVFADGRALDGVLGGAAFYALSGAALWDDDVVLLRGAGADAEQRIVPWMRRAGLSVARLRLDGLYTPRNILIYRDDGGRTETPAFGPDHLQRLQPQGGDLAAALVGARGAYVFHDVDAAFWTPVIAARRAQGAILLWELSSDICGPGHLAAVAAVASQVDALSINLEETRGLFGDLPMPALIAGLRGLGAPAAFLRCGPAGSVVITPDEAVRVPACPGAVVDVTGAGNAYGGGALAGLAAGAGALNAAQMGAVAAQLTIAQHGPFAPREAAVRAHAHATLGDLALFTAPSTSGPRHVSL
jgi:sugar/nucleoside kinase (ribokinase family)